MNSLKQFSFKGNSVRTMLIDNKPYFVAVDITEPLGYRNGRDALQKHVDSEDKNTVAIRDGIGNPNKVVINESGMYSLVLSSKLPQAKQFKRWVTHDVLPEIRKTGSFNKPQSATEAIRLLYKSNTEFDDRLTNLEDNMRISGAEQYEIHELGKHRVIEALGGIDSPAYAELSRKAFAQCWKAFKQYFIIPRYSDLPKVKKDDGIYFLQKWEPDTQLKIAIEKCNKQISMKV